MKNKTLFVIAALALGAGAIIAPNAAHAARDATYQWGTFNDIDVDRSGYLDNGEYQAFAFGKADWDNDGYLEDTEWAAYTDVYYDTWGQDYDSYTYYDTDGDGFIDRSEFNEIPTIGLYEAWDYNNDNRLTSEDWDQVTAYYYDAE